MKLSFFKLVATGLVALMLTGCVTTGDPAVQKPESADSKQIKTEGAITGAVVGATVGTIFAILTGHRNAGDIAAFAAAGALLAGVGGYALGSSVAERKKQYANEEDQLNGEIKRTAEINQKLKNQNSKMIEETASLEQEIKKISESKESDQKKIKSFEQIRGNTEKAKQENDNQIKLLNDEATALIEYKNTLAQIQKIENVKKLEEEIAMLQSGIKTLDQNNQQIARISDSARIEK